MTSFLNNLAGLARGETPAGAARLSLPPRFAGPAAPVSVETAEFGAKSDDAMPSTPATPLATPPQTPGATWARADEAPVRPAAKAEAADFPQIKEPLATPHRVAAPEVPQTQEARPPLPSDPRPFEPRLSHPVQMQRPDPTTPEASRPTVTARALPHPPLIPLPASPLTGLEGRTMPMSEAAMAGRDGPHSQERPIVHVTIDRLELRAQPSQKPAPEQRRRPPPEPTVSLGDYLRGNGSGGRT